MMYNPQLETFLRVADAGSFNKAAEELFITPPAVIKADHLAGGGAGSPAFHPQPPGAEAHRGRQVHLPGCPVCHPILQGLGGAGQECR